jgi:hypothetical protein
MDLKGIDMPNYKIAVTLCILLLLTLCLNESARAQSEEKKFEVGAQISGIAGGAFGDRESLGGGGRFTYNLSKNFALEGELNYFTSNRSDDFHRFQGQFGVKSGLRFNKFGLFGKVRPGFVNTRQDFLIFVPISCVPATACGQSIIPISGSDSDTGFSLDVGGVAELYPSKRIVVRLDVGDTIMNHRDPSLFRALSVFNGQTTPVFGVSSFLAIPGRSYATHNLQLSAGVGFRF